MEHPEITRLYKYRAYNIHSLSILINRKVWFAKPDSFNDPFDCKIPFDHRLTSDEAMAYGRKIGMPEKNINAILNSKGEIQKGFIEEWGTTLKASDEEFEKMGVFTLSESSNNILLWSHYADGQRGFCIEFVRNPDNRLGNYELTRRVQYSTDYPIINPTKKDAFDLKFFTKASDWAYEREWRLVYDEGDVEELFPDVDISAIIFGLRMPESHREIIRRVTSDIVNIKYCQAVKVPNRFELGIEDV
jgi:hypothetical protein